LFDAVAEMIGLMPMVRELAPNTSPRPCGKVSRPALTRPMVVIVVALDDCTSSVTTAPQNAPRNGVAAALLSAVRSAGPATAFRPAVMTVMPSRNKPTPPRIETVVDIRAPVSIEHRTGNITRSQDGQAVAGVRTRQMRQQNGVLPQHSDTERDSGGR
jgi:hypothetical protein